jgi:hypothetical protein
LPGDIDGVVDGARPLRSAGIAATDAGHYPADATEIPDGTGLRPNGKRLECTNHRQGGRHRQDHWRDGGGRPLFMAGMSGCEVMMRIAKVEAMNGQVAR